MLEQIMQNYPVLGSVIWGNSLMDWGVALFIFALVFGGLKLFQVFVIAYLKKIFKRTKTEIDDIVINSIDSIYWPFYLFIALYAAMKYVSLPERLDTWIDNIFLILLVVFVIKFLSKFVDYGAKFMMRKRTEAEQGSSIVRLLSNLIKLSLWAGALVLVLANLGVNVTSLIAGLGIGGIAIGLALQNVLGDLFSSFAIYLDKPFKEGDFIIVDNYMGTVKRVGVKTTRIEALRGEEIVMSNTDLTGARVQNFGKMERRRTSFDIGVTYDTPAEKLKKIPEMIKAAVESVPGTELDRCHFREFGDSALIYETVYYVDSPEMAEFMETRQSINLKLVESFNQANIEFAFPTRTVVLQKDQS